MMNFSWLSSILVGAGCLALGYCIGRRYPACLFLSLSGANDTTISKANKKKTKEPFEIEKLADILEDFKMVLVVRNDLKMGKGKIAAQCSHATLGLYKKLVNRAPKALNRWEMCAQPKVVVKIDSEEEMLVLQTLFDVLLVNLPVTNLVYKTHDFGWPKQGVRIQLMFLSVLVKPERAKSLNLPIHITIDAGRTQIAPNSRTVMAILGPIEMVDDVTGGLKLL